ncbi:lipoprotein lipase-like [Hypanus sabinus]|uniref:lipoprotein lipase-like n=1 Tax=Hypanus sabinus TaxID=79690 RepID=UPI0028C4438C|nr:lipoprotein lipase-like [Hypanus sabinus]
MPMCGSWDWPWICILLSPLFQVCPRQAQSHTAPETKKYFSNIVTKFSLQSALDPEGDSCYLIPGQLESISECNFNQTARTFLIIHGWTVTGMFESWIPKLVLALYEREGDSNVIVVDWLTRAHQHYPIAADNTKLVGRDIAHFIEWLQEELNFPAESIHMLGYSLGAHVAGFAGTYGAHRVGRITGLDPAGPDFEGAEAQFRLSPDDAAFVDALHTFTRGSLGRSIGIQQPVAHVDIYPNGGNFQPGCSLGTVFGNMRSQGVYAVADVIKCQHERAIHLFIDSLLNKNYPSLAYRCSNQETFERGMCLSCRKNRCNTLGYDVRKVRSKRSGRMYLKTAADMPFRVYHYQLKIHFFRKVNQSETAVNFRIMLYGTLNETGGLAISVPEISPNSTSSFLVHTEADIGELLMVKLKWDTTSSIWSTIMGKVTNPWSLWRLWSSREETTNALEIRRMRVKAGETQKKIMFCAKDSASAKLQPAQEVTFVKCQNEQTRKKSDQ